MRPLAFADRTIGAGTGFLDDEIEGGLDHADCQRSSDPSPAALHRRSSDGARVPRPWRRASMIAAMMLAADAPSKARLPVSIS